MIPLVVNTEIFQELNSLLNTAVSRLHTLYVDSKEGVDLNKYREEYESTSKTLIDEYNNLRRVIVHESNMSTTGTPEPVMCDPATYTTSEPDCPDSDEDDCDH